MGDIALCLTITHHDLGPADGLLDESEGLLVLRPSLTPEQKQAAAVELLERAGVPQPGPVVRCVCGEPLPLGRLRCGRRCTIASLLLVLIVAILAAVLVDGWEGIGVVFSPRVS